MNLTRNFFYSHVFRSFNRLIASSPYAPIIKVFSTNEDDVLKLSFRYANSNNISFRANKNESAATVLSKIKTMAALQQKKNEIFGKYQLSAQVTLEKIEDIDVSLFEENMLLDSGLSNSEAWTRASVLKIGDIVYEVKYNMPSVVTLSVPDYIVSGCVIRPHFILENASIDYTSFIWYHSLSNDEVTEFKNAGKENEILEEKDKFWLKVHDGFFYFTSKKDIGRYIRLSCIPKSEDQEGLIYFAVSKSTVEPAPTIFPFEERQIHTSTFTDDSSIRCLSYNTLANIYVEKRKFPYTSHKARDGYYRRQLILKELLGYKSDVICLQEVQNRMFEFDLVPAMTQFGYQGFYTRKGGHRYEGVATFYNLSKYKVLRNYGILLNQVIKSKDIYTDLLTKVGGNFKDMSKLLAQDTALQLLLLQHNKYPERKLLVANTHLYSNKDTPEVRLIQAAICLYYIEHTIRRKDLQSVPFIFCGDFNSLPDSDTYNFMVDGNYKCCTSWTNNSDNGSDTTLRHSMCLGSACGTPEYTNYTVEFKGCLDYIFYSKNSLDVTEVVPMPKHEDVIANLGLPSELFPSDHIALVCTLQYKNS